VPQQPRRQRKRPAHAGRRAARPPAPVQAAGATATRRAPAFVGLPTYLHLPYAETADDLVRARADVAIVGAPVDMGVVYRPGARFGPRAIRQATYLGQPAENLYHLPLSVYPFRRLRGVDAGDANCPPSSLELSHDAIRAKVAEVCAAGAIPLVLGGDHSITLPSATAVADHHGRGDIGLIHFDAHADTGDKGYGGVLISHGSPMRRLIESGAVPGRNFVQVGLRGWWPPHDVFEWMAAQGMRWHLMEEIRQRGFDFVLERALSETLDGPRKVYLSVDIDVVDPGFAPGTGTPEPGGLTPNELLYAVRRIAQSTEVVAMDVVEVSPPYDGPGETTAQLAHRVVLEAISALAWKRSLSA
jgi:agmatinase